MYVLYALADFVAENFAWIAMFTIPVIIALEVENIRLKKKTDELSQRESEHIAALSRSNAKCKKLEHEYLKLRNSASYQSLAALSAENQRLKKEFQPFHEPVSQNHPWLAALYSDWLETYDNALVSHLRDKIHAAPLKAQEVERIVRGELREMRQKWKQEQYQRLFYEQMFPVLLDFKELTPDDAQQYVGIVSEASDDDAALVRNGYLSHEEFANLSESERNQLALDRYIKKDKSNWQIGIEYERYIGWRYEQSGYSVKYHGAIKGFEDMGRDLIAVKGNTVHIVQCKRWAKEKIIHENHIFQLAGSTYEYRYHHPEQDVIGVFVTTTSISPIATECGTLLGLKLRSNVPFEEYPRIKCNIGTDETGAQTKIYHLPMDQQYDNVLIDRPGEFFAWTVAEAEAAGFRRAHRWRSSKAKEPEI